MGYIKRSVSSLAKKAKKFVKKRYGFNKKSGGPRYGKIASDVLMLKKMINAEKKVIEYAYGGLEAPTIFNIGQVNGTAASGAFILDITPFPQLGNQVNQRNGNSIKACSALYQFQIQQMSAMTIDTTIIIEFWIVKGTPEGSATTLANLFTPATFSGVIDTNSARNQDKFNDYQLIRRFVKKQKADSLSNDANLLTFNVPMKFNRGKGHHVRLATDNVNILNGQMMMTLRASVGNMSSTTNSTRPVPYATVLNSGQTVRFASKLWYYDN